MGAGSLRPELLHGKNTTFEAYYIGLNNVLRCRGRERGSRYKTRRKNINQL